MYYIKQHIADILSLYKGDVPLAYFLKNYFRQYPKLGSRDRKILSAMTYSFYRCSKGFDDQLTTEEKIEFSVFVCDNDKRYIEKNMRYEWQDLQGGDYSQRIQRLRDKSIDFDYNKLMPYDIPVSPGITRREWLLSMLSQPRLFIYVFPKYAENVVDILTLHGIEYERVNDTCLSLSNGSSVDKILKPDTYRVQDASSQQTGTFFNPRKGETWWDACCGAGGKSLLLLDREQDIKLTVSDVRESILHNLSDRFRLYHYNLPERKLISVAEEQSLRQELGNRRFDRIICDVPCSGSGTWSRTPEQLYFLDPAVVQMYASKQAAIVGNAVEYLKPGGKLFYITCSVFESENEAVINNLLKEKGISLLDMRLINGSDMKADSMFIAIVQKD